MKSNVFAKLTTSGVVARERVKNDLQPVGSLVRQQLLKKIYKKKRVFYELTEKSLPLLNHFRLQLLEEARLRFFLYPRRQEFYRALLEDVRFFDSSKEEAEEFCFLGDWRLNMPPTKSQLQLAQLRFYQDQGVV